ncbi:hypothetical protein K1719_006291 [Acacia pycnantha]|nr:hypothetical protein K1719_006291 [Acacia pycnantha]
MISYGEKRDLELPFLDNNANWVFVCDQCNGILCLSGRSHLILWNPATKEAKAIPERDRFLFLSVIGFGFDPITNDYKIVRLLCDEKNSIEVYSLNSDCWRTIYVDNAPYRLRENGIWNSYLNGFYHWLGSSERDDTYILSFDFSKEVLGVIKLPLEVSSSRESVGVLGGSLACVSFSQYGNFEIWVMNEYGVENSWTKKFQIESNRAVNEGALDKAKDLLHNDLINGGLSASKICVAIMDVFAEQGLWSEADNIFVRKRDIAGQGRDVVQNTTS